MVKFYEETSVIDFAEIARAVRDDIKEREIPQIDSKLLAKAVYDEVIAKIAEALKDIPLMMESYKNTLEQFKEIEKGFIRVEKQQERVSEQIENLLKKSKNDLDSMHKTYELGFSNLQSLLRSLPIPQVNINNQIDVEPTPITVDNYMDAPIINVPKASVTIENHMDAPIINVPKAEVIVNVPVPAPREKIIEYNEDKQPVKIIERDIKDKK